MTNPNLKSSAKGKKTSLILPGKPSGRTQITISATPEEVLHCIRCIEMQPMFGISYETKKISQYTQGLTIYYSGKPNDLSKLLLIIISQSLKLKH